MTWAMVKSCCIALFGMLLSGMLLSGTAIAQSQNAAKTGVGDALETLEALQVEVDKQWSGLPGQFVKGAVGLVGLEAALSAADKALSFQLRIKGDGSADTGGGALITTTPGTNATTTTSSTSTN